MTPAIRGGLKSCLRFRGKRFFGSWSSKFNVDTPKVIGWRSLACAKTKVWLSCCSDFKSCPVTAVSPGSALNISFWKWPGEALCSLSVVLHLGIQSFIQDYITPAQTWEVKMVSWYWMTWPLAFHPLSWMWWWGGGLGKQGWDRESVTKERRTLSCL